MKRIISTFIAAVFILLVFSLETNAASYSNTEKRIINGQPYFIETTISENATFLKAFRQVTANSKTATKTSTIKDSNGAILWSLSVTGTFSYDGNTARCTSCSHQASAGSGWTIQNSSSGYSGNSATAIATAKRNGLFGYSMTESVTITCSASGVIE